MADPVPLHQLELRGPGRAKTDDARVAQLLRGRCSLAESLGVDRAALEPFRRQAAILFEAKKWRAAADVIEGMIALDAADTALVAMLARSLRELGDVERADKIETVLNAVLAELEARAKIEEDVG